MPRLTYFAYGANLDLGRFRRRCRDATVVGRARLADFRLAFTRYSTPEKGGVADIVAEPGATVWGVIYDIDAGCLASLDEYEGAPRAYRRESLHVIDESGEEHDVIVYIANKTGDFAPSRQYLAQITKGARAHGLPDDYVRAIEAVRTHA